MPRMPKYLKREWAFFLDEWKAGEVWIRNYEDDREGNILRPYEAVIIAFTGK